MKKILIEKLNKLPDVEVANYKDSALLCVFYAGKEVAHFQNDSEIDIRLSRSIIKREGLMPPPKSLSHPDRSKNSIWIIQQFQSEDDVDQIIHLINLAIQLRQ